MIFWARRRGISAASPSSASTSSVWAPSSGAGSRTRHGVAPSFTGNPVIRTGPWPGCSTSSTISCASTWGSLNTSREVGDPAARHARGVQVLDPVRDGAGADALADQRIDGVAVAQALGVAGILRALEHGLDAERAEEAPHDVVGAGRDGHLAVLRLVEAVRRRDRMLVARARRELAGAEILRAQVRHHADEPVHQARLDALAARHVAPPRDEGAGHAERAVEPRDQIADRRGRAHRLLALAPVHRHEPAHRLGDEVEGRALGVGPGAAIAIDAAHDQVRVQLGEPRLAEAHAGEHAGPVVLDQHVGPLEETGQDGLALLGVEIEGDRLLVPVELGEVPRQAVHDRALPANGIALARRLDLDDLGAHVAEEHAAERARENAGQVDDAETGQGHRANPPAAW